MGSGASIEEGSSFDYDKNKDAVIKELSALRNSDPGKFNELLAEVTHGSRRIAPAFGCDVVVKDVPTVPEAEIDAFKEKYLSNEYFCEGDECKQRLAKSSDIQLNRWKFVLDNIDTYVNVLRAAGHTDEKIQGVFDGLPICWATKEIWDEFCTALGELATKIQTEQGWGYVQFVHTGSSVPGFSQNPQKGFRDLPSKITDSNKSDVDICIVGQGVVQTFTKLAEGDIRMRKYPTTTGHFTMGTRFGVKNLNDASNCVSEFHKEWEAKLPGGLQFTFAEHSQGIPPWEMFCPTNND